MKRFLSALALMLTTLTFLVPAPAAAQQAAAPVEDAVRAMLIQETAGLPGEVTLTIGALDSRNRLPECAAFETFLPSGTRAWGQISVGVRCVSPVIWTVYVPARVAVAGDYLVTARPIRPGQIIGGADITREHGDLTALPEGTLLAPEQALGQRARYAVATGQPLRANMLRLPPAVQQGQTVKVIGTGQGFSVANEGRAMKRAADGEPVRVRLSNGQVVTGIARNGGIVEVQF